MAKKCKDDGCFDNKQVVPAIDVVKLLSDKIKGSTTLNKDLFNLKVNVPALKCKRKSCGIFQRHCRKLFLNRPKYPSIIEDVKDNESRIILLNPTLVNAIDDLPENVKNIIQQQNVLFITYELHLRYNDFTFDEIMKMILPNDISDTVTSFETVGHIAHVNLKESLLMYKSIIGEALLSKNGNIKTVVNKTNSIEETYRFFKMELLAGENNMVTKVIEHGNIFEFDYSKVYWNSRLQTEHQRIVDQLEEGDFVYDVFAGVGPFAIPAAKKGCIVHANDLNESSFKYLKHNSKLNKLEENKIRFYNVDGRKFIETIVIEGLSVSHEDHSKKLKPKKHVIMNLPALAVEFLDVFRFSYTHFDLPLKIHEDIIIHCYLFSKSNNPHVDSELMISSVLGFDIAPNVKTHFVRRVAPNKVMMCASFKLVWYDKEVKKCTCYSSTSIITGRKRPLEGGINPMMEEKTKFAYRPSTTDLDDGL